MVANIISGIKNVFFSDAPQWKKEAFQYRDQVRVFLERAKGIQELNPDIVAEISNQIRDLKNYRKGFPEIDIPLIEEFDALEDQLKDELLNQSFYQTADRVATGLQIAKELVPLCARSFAYEAVHEFSDRLPNLASWITLIPKMSGKIGYRCAKLGHKWTEQLGGAALKFASKEYPSPRGILRFASDAAIVYAITKGWSDPYDPLAYVVGAIGCVTRNHLGMSPAWDVVEADPVQEAVYNDQNWEEDVKAERESIAAPPVPVAPPGGGNPFGDLPIEDEW